MTDSLDSAPESPVEEATRARSTPTSTVGRGKAIKRADLPEVDQWSDGQTTVIFGDSLDHYAAWDAPDCIVSDGAYGVLGFEGDTSDHTGMPEWYEPHIAEWSARAKGSTMLWFWNSEICQRRRKSRPLGGAKVGHLAPHLGNVGRA